MLTMTIFVAGQKKENRMRLIDANKLIELCHIMAEKCDDTGASVWNQFATCIEWSPSVDAVEVIKCKDCAHRREYKTILKGLQECSLTGKTVREDYYCSWAKGRNAD